MKPDSFLIPDFLDEILDRASEHFNEKAYYAFLDWYIEAEFGPDVRWKFTDGAGDGGIDAVVWLGEASPGVVLIQSKFAEHIGSKQLPQAAYAEFAKVVEAFYGREKAFEEFLGRVREDVRALYQRVFDLLLEIHNWNVEKKAFRLITTCNRKAASECELVPTGAYIYAPEILRLYGEYRTAQTPKARPLELTVTQTLKHTEPRRGVTSYLFNARVLDFGASGYLVVSGARSRPPQWK